jgi:hypothetical protein
MALVMVLRMGRVMAVLGLTVLGLAPAETLRATDRNNDASRADAAIARAVAFLAKESPAWRPENNCYSCHNNGDGARVLYVAQRLGHAVEPQALDDTTAWLVRPEQWESNAADEGDGGQILAAIQFSAALVDALAAKARDVRTGQAALERAAAILAAGQEANGSWTVGAQGALGSPVTYGNYLATVFALRTLKVAVGEPAPALVARDFAPLAARVDQDGRQRSTDAKTQELRLRIAKAEAWLRAQRPKNVLDASATVIGLHGAEDADAREQRLRCVELLRAAENESGGWGPYVISPPETFDTAIAMLALSMVEPQANVQAALDRGRRWLVENQLEDGAWRETTRPAGAFSYAHQMSTTAWATQALLATRAASASKTDVTRPQE